MKIYHSRAGVVLTLICGLASTVPTLAAPGRFQALEEEAAEKRLPSVFSIPIIGDANDDCVVNVNDLTLALAYDPAADFNRDGQVNQIDIDMVQALWGSTCGKRLIGDVNGDGQVNTTDLNLVLGQWNSSVPQPDFNGDGIVDGIDLDMLLANWGRQLGERTWGDWTGDDVVNVEDLASVLGNWDAESGQLRLDLVLALWGWTSGVDLTGDIDGNEHVNLVDQQLLLAVWGTPWAQADLDGDGTVGVQDLVILNANFGSTSGVELPGDINGDWITDAVDLDLLNAVYGTDWVQADLNLDGTVDIQDLLILNANFGTTYGQVLTGDVNGSCEVDAVDENIVLAVWGAIFAQADLDIDGSVGVTDLVVVLGNWDQTCP